MTEAVTRPLEWSPPRRAISRVPYLPGLDGMRALAVGSVMVYHANPEWLPGGFLGVEMFFVISGYLITLLLIGEHERSGTVSLRHFYLRRARRLLPALFTLLIGITVYTTLFRREALGQLRGDVLAALTYVSNWYQIWVGQGYTASGDFAPLRHLWSLAVEEQFYLIWPLVMIALIRLGRRNLPQLSTWLFAASILVTVVMALLYEPGPIESCAATPDAYWQVAGRCINKTEFLYLGTFTRCGGLLLGAAFAMIWRPVAVMRGPLRRRGAVLDGIALLGLVGLGALCWTLHIITTEGADPWLFRGGFFLTGLATVAVMAAVTHRHTLAGPLLGNVVFLWIGTRSYGLYLYHWPIYQIMRGQAGVPLSVGQFVIALAISAAITEVSFRFIETPIRKGHVGRWWRRLQAARDPAPRRIIAGAGAAIVALSVFAAANLATAELKQNEVAQSLDEGAESVQDVEDLLPAATTEPATATTDGTSATGPATDPAAIPPGPTLVTTSTVPPTTLPPTTTVPPPPPPILAIGDSVMLGAAEELTAQGLFVDAEVSRQMNSMTPTMAALRDAGQLGDTVIVHLGTNGRISDETVTEFFSTLTGVRKVVALTISLPPHYSYTADNNAKIAALPAQFPNVSVLYWDGLAPACPGDCFASDGYHLREDGRNYYTQLIMSQITPT